MKSTFQNLILFILTHEPIAESDCGVLDILSPNDGDDVLTFMGDIDGEDVEMNFSEEANPEVEWIDGNTVSMIDQDGDTVTIEFLQTIKLDYDGDTIDPED
jgi:hypothetical protein